MRAKFVPGLIREILACGVALLFFVQIAAAQLLPASPPIADPADTRFREVHEDWTSPALSGSDLQPVPP